MVCASQTTNRRTRSSARTVRSWCSICASMTTPVPRNSRPAHSRLPKSLRKENEAHTGTVSDLSSHHGEGELDLPDVRMRQETEARPSLVAPRRNHRKNPLDQHSPLSTFAIFAARLDLAHRFFSAAAILALASALISRHPIDEAHRHWQYIKSSTSETTS
jgi:hypothetical protein